ncbi:transporter [Sulfurifustis variabilis]|uniref:Transporter n=2 Tax=Sulfurifustis variabilis TaxID=1675686 RepID=A0A1B4VC61_9GAMM|nr:transporter [Sulfurifustis variabilis]
MLAFWLLVRAPMGVSSSWDHVVHWRDYERMRRAEQALAKNQDAVTDALLAETIAQFGNAAIAEFRAKTAPQAKKIRMSSTAKAPWPTHFTFLACMLLGGLFASFFAGTWEVQWSLGPEFERLFGAGWHTWVLLTAGGFLVGFGTRMAGGCTSGHGVNGCARLQPGSLVGTASFFGTAVAMTLLLERVL